METIRFSFAQRKVNRVRPLHYTSLPFVMLLSTNQKPLHYGWTVKQEFCQFSILLE